MTTLDRQVKSAQSRLWCNRWLRQLCWSATAVTGVYAVLVLVSRLWGLEWPLGVMAAGAGCLALAGSLGWSLVGRPGRHAAAAALDEAAGLRERVSSGLYCTTSEDPFEQAVYQDAERVAGSVTVRQHLRLRFPFQAVYSGIAALVAGIMLLLPDGMLEETQAHQQRTVAEQVARTQVEVQKRLQPIKKLAETNPALKDLKEELEKLETPLAKMDQPQNIRHEALKKIDKMADALREQQAGERYDKVNEMKKMLRGIKQQNEGMTENLSKALADGNFKAAQEEIKQLQEKLATLKHQEDQQMVKQLEEQLKDLAKQLDKVADDKVMKEKLEQAGLKKEDIEKMLQNLSKKDMEQIKKELEKSGLAKKDIDKLAQQLAKRKDAAAACQKMSQAMKQAASAAGQGQTGEAMDQMQSAGDQLSEMEQMEQEMSQLESQMAELQDAKKDLESCSKCNGTGQCNGQRCGACQGSGMGQPNQGGGMGRLGQGRGGLAPKGGETNFGTKIVRQKVHTGKGRIIGQFLVDAEQVKGDVSTPLAEVISAEERDATDAISRDRIPRQYQKSVKEYFSYVQKALTGGTTPADEKPEASSESDGEDRSED
jgi:hypothetical protein